MPDITILTLVDRISSFYSLRPFLLHEGKRHFHYTSSPEYCLTTDRNEILIMVRQFIKPDRVDLDLMRRLRAKYRTIAFFHDDAGGGIPRLEVLPYVDLFYSKALFRDRSLYGRSLYGKELYSDHYHANYGINDPDHRERAVATDPAQLAKLRLSFNIGVGDLPRQKLRQRAGTAAALLLGSRSARWFYTRSPFPADPVKKNSGAIPVHARILPAPRPSIAYQRKLIMEKIGGDPRFLTGETSQDRYNKELLSSKIVLSPFGWGELCVRDYEAVRAGALLLKPDMSHLETWPDIFVPGETYVPFSWDAEDLLAKVDACLADDALRRRIAQAGVDAYRSQLAGLQDRFERIMAEIEEVNR